jgi:hypothetical protein
VPTWRAWALTTHSGQYALTRPVGCLVDVFWLARVRHASTTSFSSLISHFVIIWTPSNLKKLQLFWNFVPHSLINRCGRPWFISTPIWAHFTQLSPLSSMSSTIDSWSPNTQSFIDLLNTDKPTANAPKEFLSSSPLHHRPDVGALPQPCALFSPTTYPPPYPYPPYPYPSFPYPLPLAHSTSAPLTYLYPPPQSSSTGAPHLVCPCQSSSSKFEYFWPIKSLYLVVFGIVYLVEESFAAGHHLHKDFIWLKWMRLSHVGIIWTWVIIFPN